MTDTYLQRLTKSVSDIGRSPSDGAVPHSGRRTLPSRRQHITERVRVSDRTFYTSLRYDPTPAELFLRVKGIGCTVETIAMYGQIARLASIALQCGVSVTKVADLSVGGKFAAASPLLDHSLIKNCTSRPDLIGRHLLPACCGRAELGHPHEPGTVGHEEATTGLEGSAWSAHSETPEEERCPAN
jgi:hypothetical protein